MIVRTKNNRLRVLPKVSVIMTTYNSEKTVVNAIRSVLSQSYQNIELVVVDDNSTDNTVSVVEKELKRAKRETKLIRSKENNGTYFCRNVGIQVSTGAYITCHDSDDTASKLYVEKLMVPHLTLKKKPKITVCMTNRRTTQGEVLCAVSACFDRKLIKQIGYFDSVRISADTEFRLRCKKVFGKNSVHVVGEKLYFANKSDSSLTGSPTLGYNSNPRRAYIQSFRRWHRGTQRSELSSAFAQFPLLGPRPFKVPLEILTTADSVPPPVKIDLEGIDTLYVVKRTAKTVEGGSGYTVRTGQMAQSFDNVAVVLNPEIGFNDKHIDNTVEYVDGIPHLYFNKRSIYKFIQEQEIKRIILPSDAENFLSFKSGLKKNCDETDIKFTYEMRGLWYLSGQANVMQRTNGSPLHKDKKRYWGELPLKEKKAVLQADSLVFITNELKDYVVKNFNNNQKFFKPCVVIPNGYEPKGPHKRQDNTFTIGYFGSISPYEGIDMLIDTCRDMNHGLNKPIVKLHLIGNWKSHTSIDKKDLSFVKHEEWKPRGELEDAYSDIDLFCIPRLPYDVCQIISPLKPFHSLYNKVPLLMADTMCLKDIAQGGKNCLLFKSGDSEDLKKKILQVKNNGYSKKMLENGKKWVVENREWHNIRSKYKRFMEEQ